MQYISSIIFDNHRALNSRAGATVALVASIIMAIGCFGYVTLCVLLCTYRICFLGVEGDGSCDGIPVNGRKEMIRNVLTTKVSKKPKIHVPT